MKNKLFILLSVIIITLLVSCKTREAFITSSPPIQPFFPEQVGVSYCSPPPIMLPITKTIDEIEVSSQYFKIAVPVVFDKTAKATAIKNMIDEEFVTALDKTKRFNVMDKSSMLNITQQEYETGIYSEKDTTKKQSVIDVKYTSTSQPTLTEINSPGLPTSTSNTITKVEEPKTNISQYFGKFEYYPNIYEDYIKSIEPYTDGILRITITGFDDKKNQLDIDYKINSSLSDMDILYTGKGKIGFTMEKNAATLTLNRDDIEKIADDIVKSFPNPDLATLQIIQINGKKITVNSGKNDNIKVGMLGYVVRQEGKRTAYRAMFEVTEVFPDAFNAELKVEDLTKLKNKNVLPQDYAQYPYLLNTIKVGELVKMK